MAHAIGGSGLLGCVAIVFALSPPAGTAATFRCGAVTIREGMAAAEIVAQCAEPSSIETTTEPVMSRLADGTLIQVGTETIDYWRYDLGTRRFPMRVTVKNGVAVKIERMSRNTGKPVP